MSRPRPDIPGPSAAKATAYVLRTTLWARPGACATLTALTLLAGSLGTVSALLLRSILDGLAAARHLAELRTDVILLALVAVATAMLPPTTQYLASQLRRSVSEAVQDRLVSAVTGTVGLAALEDPDALDRLRLAQQAATTGPEQTLNAVFGAVQAVVGVAGFTGCLAVADPWLALIAFASAVPRLAIQLRVNRARAGMMLGTSASVRRQAVVRSLLSDAAAGMEIRLFGLGRFFRDRLAADLRAVNRAERRVDLTSWLSQAPLAFLAAAVSAGGLLWAIDMAGQGRITLGDVTVFVGALAAVQSGVAIFVQNLAALDQSAVSFRYLLAIVGEADAAAGSAVVTGPDALRTGIEFHDVWFRYKDDGPWILRGVDLVIEPGLTVALVGLNGAGKSTLIKLLCRLYEPTRGRITWDGVDIAAFDPQTLRSRISAAFQNPTRYDLTAAENIGVGAVEAIGDRDLIRRSAERSGVAEAIERLPEGYDTLLSRILFAARPGDPPSRGTQLSGGQWQRVALARGFMRHGADLLILDEPSTGLDPEAEHRMRIGMRALRSGNATILVSHRLSDVRTADRVVVLADGRIAEEGTHDELIDGAGEYARLFGLQAEGYRDTAAIGAAP